MREARRGFCHQGTEPIKFYVCRGTEFIAFWNYQGAVSCLRALAGSRFEALLTYQGCTIQPAINRDEFFNFIVRVSICAF
jgi:hypothetical protein